MIGLVNATASRMVTDWSTILIISNLFVFVFLQGQPKKNHNILWPIIVAQKPIIMAHDRISDLEKNHGRKNLTYRWLSLSRKKQQ